MAYIKPSSNVKLYSNVKITGNQNIAFSSRANQQAYFNKHLVVTDAELQYVRRKGWVMVKNATSQVNKCNYMSFANPDFENVTFYAMITDYEYQNNGATLIKYTIDYWQTFCFDTVFEPSMIIRQQLSDSDYNKAVANPYRIDIPELLTDEGIAVGKEFEAPFGGYGAYQSGNTIQSFPGENATVPQLGGTGIVRPNENAHDMYGVIVISPFDQSAITLPAWQSFVDSFDYKVGIPNSISTTEHWGGIDANFLRPFGYGCIKYNPEVPGEFLYKLQDILDFLTVQGVSSNVIAMYMLPAYMIFMDKDVYSDGLDYSLSKPPAELMRTDIHRVNFDVTPKEGYQNPKVHTYPYRYIRVHTPGDDIKEYKVHDFLNVSLFGEKEINFAIMANMTGLPVLMMLPCKYKYLNLNQFARSYLDTLNFEERVEYQNFPQAAYSIDSYLAFLANQYAQAVGKETAYTGTQRVTGLIGGYTGAAAGIVGGAISGNPMSIVGGIQSGVNTATNYMTEERALIEAQNTRMSGVDDISSIESGKINGLYQNARTAYVSDEYHAGSNGGYSSYQMDRLFFTIEFVDLQPEYKAEIDKFFTTQGYSVCRIMVPYVCNYVSGSTDETETPKFLSFGGEDITYVQTENMHCVCNMKVASDYIAAMFNNGTRFLKGESLS